MVLGLKGPGRVGRRRILDWQGGRPGRAGPQAVSPSFVLLPVSTLAIVILVLAALLLLFLTGGFLGARKRHFELGPLYQQHLREADHALEQARAADRGWDRDVMETVVRSALADAHPGTAFDRLNLVLVDDRPGVHQDRAHFEAHAGDRPVRVVLSRGEAGWSADVVG